VNPNRKNEPSFHQEDAQLDSSSFLARGGTLAHSLAAGRVNLGMDSMFMDSRRRSVLTIMLAVVSQLDGSLGCYHIFLKNIDEYQSFIVFVI
jgi:hypothetical protein